MGEVNIISHFLLEFSVGFLLVFSLLACFGPGCGAAAAFLFLFNQTFFFPSHFCLQQIECKIGVFHEVM